MEKKIFNLNWIYLHKIFVTMYSIPYTRPKTSWKPPQQVSGSFQRFPEVSGGFPRFLDNPSLTVLISVSFLAVYICVFQCTPFPTIPHHLTYVCYVVGTPPCTTIYENPCTQQYGNVMKALLSLSLLCWRHHSLLLLSVSYSSTTSIEHHRKPNKR